MNLWNWPVKSFLMLSGHAFDPKICGAYTPFIWRSSACMPAPEIVPYWMTFAIVGRESFAPSGLM